VKYKETMPDGTHIQTTFWFDKDIAPPQFMYESFQQRRSAVADDCWQLKQDLDSYNKFVNKGATIQILFDYRDDMEERELSARDNPPPLDSDDEN
jgi:hypothetical protein